LLEGYGSSSDDDEGDDDSEEKFISKSKSPLNASSPRIPKHEDGDVLQTNTNLDEGTGDRMESTNGDGAISSINTSETQKEENRDKKPRPCRFYFRKGSCRNGNNCRFSHDDSRFGHKFDGAQHLNQQQQDQHQRKPSASPFSQENRKTKKRKRGVHTSSDTLLRKLLENDMERESVLSMQLLEFIVDNNFFLNKDGTSKKQQKEFITKE